MRFIKVPLLYLRFHYRKCCGFFGCGRDDAETVTRAGDRVLQRSMEVMAIAKWPCKISPWPGFPDEDPPMVKSATYFDRGKDDLRGHCSWEEEEDEDGEDDLLPLYLSP